MADLILSAVQMNSLEISELVKSRHDKVRQSIERLAERGVIELPPMGEVEDKQSLSPNNKSKVYIFSGEKGKRDSLVVVAQLSPEFTGALVDRWQTLESGQATPAYLASGVQPLLDANRLFRSNLSIAKTVFSGNQALLSANNATLRATGTNVLRNLDATHLLAPTNTPLLTVTDIELRLGIGRRAGNPLLIDCELQAKHRDHKGNIYYELTSEGQKYGVAMDTSKSHSNGTPIRQLKWSTDVLPILVARLQVEREHQEDVA